MAELTQKYKKDFQATTKLAGLKLVEENSISAYIADDKTISGEIAENNQIISIKAWIFQKQIHWRCDCQKGIERKTTCHHLWAFFLLADKNEDFAFGKKKGITLNGIKPLVENKESEEETTEEHFTTKNTSNDEKVDITLLLKIESVTTNNLLRCHLLWAAKNKQGIWSNPAPVMFNSPNIHTDFTSDFSHFIIKLLTPFLIQDNIGNVFEIPDKIVAVLFPEIIKHKRLFIIGNKKTLIINNEEFKTHFEFQEIDNGYNISLAFNGNESSVNGSDIFWLGENGCFLTNNSYGRADLLGTEKVIKNFIKNSSITYNKESAQKLCQHLISQTQYGTQDLPAELLFEHDDILPTGSLFFRPAKFKFNGAEWLHAELSFDYDGIVINEVDTRKILVNNAKKQFIDRQWQIEFKLRELLLENKFRYAEKSFNEEIGWKLAPRHLDTIVKALLPLGWHIVAEGKTYRLPTEKKAIMSMNNDWFELEGGVAFGNEVHPFPQLLDMIKNKQEIIVLGDGSFGVLPLEWLMNYTVLSEFAIVENDLLKFKKSQIHLLNSLLEKLDITFDEQAMKTKDALQQSVAYSAEIEPDNFQGTLRHYQKIGLGWLLFIKKLNLGGCLADDMGLGKTVQVLSLLQHCYNNLECHKPTLLVLPRSLMFNWQLEAEKFTPNLKIHIHAGNGRMQQLKAMSQADIVLTTYGTIRRDAGALRHFTFFYCILDEAQAIKNSDSAISKAVQLIKAEYRLAISGTPIENSLSDLLNIFQFLNPGLLQYSTLLKNISEQRKLSPNEIIELRKLLSPLILRRTKIQAAPELPPKSENIIYCDMPLAQRHHYNQLKNYYKKQLLENEVNPSGKKIEVLSALLKLRQAACHPGLVNPEFMNNPSGKIEILLEKIIELKNNGHKILIFSQFVKFLQIVEANLQENTINYCYLDGKTKNRQEIVHEFQNDETKSVFLISLKAGGVGLNLTAADYVFILDPWWNPATENQAIDRAFRIGQTKHVFAYRIIARETVEEKIMLMQQDKQTIANDIIHETTTPEDIFTTKTLSKLLE